MSEQPTVTYEERLAAANEARERAFAGYGELDPNVLRAGVETGPHYWPVGRAYQPLSGPGYYAVSTAGLGAPFEEPGAPGFGVELLVEVPAEAATEPWVFATIARVAEGLIRPGQDFRNRLDAFGTLSNEIPGDGFPDDWRSETGRVGILMGVVPPDLPAEFETPDGDVRIVPITFLRPRELMAIIQSDDARAAIAEELAARPRGHANRFDRPVATVAADVAAAPYVPEPAATPDPAPTKRPWWRFWGK